MIVRVRKGSKVQEWENIRTVEVDFAHSSLAIERWGWGISNYKIAKDESVCIVDYKREEGKE